MEFFIYNKDNRKLKTSVNLATLFKLNDTNYIVYYNTQVEKSYIDIYIGEIKYGNQCLIIEKIDSSRQNEFLSVVKDVLANRDVKRSKLEYSDYYNIIDTAIVVLEGVQKIKIATSSLDLIKKFKNPEFETENVEQTEPDTIESPNNDDSLDNDVSNDFSENDNYSNSIIDRLDKIVSENEKKLKKKKGKKKNLDKTPKISTPVKIFIFLFLLIVIIYYIVYFSSNYYIEF